MKKTQKIKHKKHPNSVHLTKKARLIKRRHQIRRQKQFLCFILFLIIILSLSFLILRPLRTSRQTHMINSACESYRSDVEQVAAKYDMSAYVDLILALMMQESSGQGTDVMQSSEGAYNTQYPQTPNGITDVDYSIACGIQELKYSSRVTVRSSPLPDSLQAAISSLRLRSPPPRRRFPPTIRTTCRSDPDALSF